MPERRIPTIERRPMLLDAAREIFGGHGYVNATLDEIADRAGVAKPVLYRHFESKQRLYEQLVLEQVERMQREVREVLSTADADADRATLVLDATFAFVEREPFTWRVLVPEHQVASTHVDTASELAGRQAMVLLRSFGLGERAGDGLEPRGELDDLWAATCTGIQVQFARWWIDHPDMARSTVVARARAVLESVASTLYAGSATRG